LVDIVHFELPLAHWKVFDNVHEAVDLFIGVQ
jgi:hypothetical protein